MKKMSPQSKVNKISPLKQSACMILFENSQRLQKLLMFQRIAKISFGNAVVFPGGACDPQDKQFSKNISNIQGFQNYSKISAIRQLYEETGILLVPSKDHSILQQINKKNFQSKNLSHQFFCQLWKDKLDLIIPLIRFLTVQFIPGKRFDTIFFTPHPSVHKINIGNLSKGNLECLQNLRMSSEGQTYFWLSVENLLQKYQKNQISLVPPQIIILNCLKNVRSFSDLLNLSPQSCFEPILMDTNNMRVFTLYGDHQFRFQHILDKQPNSESKKSFQKYFIKNRKYFQRKGDKSLRRVQIDMKEKYFDFKSHLVEKSMLGFLSINPSI